MKLYTKEQIAEAVMFCRWGGTMKKDYEEFLNKLTPIQLPSDEEIKEAAHYAPKDAHDYYIVFRGGFLEGAKWMKEQILNK